MNDTQKAEALRELLNEVLFTLQMTKYDMDNPSAASLVEREYDAYYDRLLNIIHAEPEESPGVA